MQEIIISINDLAKYTGFDDNTLRTWCYNYQLQKWLVTSKRPFSFRLCDESIKAFQIFLEARDKAYGKRKWNRLEKFNKGIKNIMEQIGIEQNPTFCAD